MYNTANNKYKLYYFTFYVIVKYTSHIYWNSYLKELSLTDESWPPLRDRKLPEKKYVFLNT